MASAYAAPAATSGQDPVASLFGFWLGGQDRAAAQVPEGRPSASLQGAIPLASAAPWTPAERGRPATPAPNPVANPPARPAAADPAAGPAPHQITALIDAKARRHGVPRALAHAVVRVESNYDPRAVGGSALGLMQIKHATAQGMGFSGSRADLFDPATNLEWGMRYLAGARRLARGDLCGTVMRYQSGHRAERMNSANHAYCQRVREFMAEHSAEIADARTR